MPQHATPSPTILRAFRRGVATEATLPAGFRLYKLTSTPLFGSGGRVTPWWTFYDAYHGDGVRAEGYEADVRRATAAGVSPVQFLRTRASVPPEWNAMGELVVIRLVHPTTAWVGQCGPQPIRMAADNKTPRAGLERVVSIGGAFQAYAPNLTRGDFIATHPVPATPWHTRRGDIV